MEESELMRLRNSYVTAFNAGALEDLEQLLAEQAEYRWVAAGRSEQGRPAVMELYRRGHQAFGGASRLTPVPGTEDQAIWWEPTCTGLQARGLQTIRIADGLIVEIADEHDAEKVSRAAEGLHAPR